MPRRLVALATVLSAPAFALAQGISFTDVTNRVGVAAEYTVFQTGFRQLEFMMAGGCVADFNRDGWEDLFILTGDKDTDKLYINNGNGTFSEQGEQWGVAKMHIGSGATVGDYNDDGWPDIYVTSLGPSNTDKRLGYHMLYRNNGDGTFTDVAEEAGVKYIGAEFPDGFSAAFGDYDLDGDLDLAVTMWQLQNDDGVALFRNNGRGSFTRVNEPMGLDATEMFGFTPVFADMDRDGYPELLVSADFGTSGYYVNNRDGSFTRRTRQECGLVDTNGMGQVVHDFTGDGLLDWYVSNICCAGAPEDWEGQNLFANQGDHTYVDIAPTVGVEHAEWAWGADACDLDNDGHVDIVTVNGWFFEGAMPNRIFRNSGDGTFENVSDASGFNHRGLARGVVSFDYDRDGDIDLVVFNHESPAVVYRNDLAGPAKNRLGVRLSTRHRPDLAPNGIGAWIELDANGKTQIRYIDGAPTYLATSTLTEHFGLAGALTVDQIRVRWPDGTTTTRNGVFANQTITIEAPPSCAYPDQNGDGAPDFGDFDTTDDGLVDLEDLYAAELNTLDINADGLANPQDKRCLRSLLRGAERDDALR
ncbi:MAG: hypothetical protein Tsb0013_01300 [Phycisphaerales bacterium]